MEACEVCALCFTASSVRQLPRVAAHRSIEGLCQEQAHEPYEGACASMASLPLTAFSARCAQAMRRCQTGADSSGRLHM